MFPRCANDGLTLNAGLVALSLSGSTYLFHFQHIHIHIFKTVNPGGAVWNTFELHLLSYHLSLIKIFVLMSILSACFTQILLYMHFCYVFFSVFRS